MNVHLKRIKLKSLQVFMNMLRFNHANIYGFYCILFWGKVFCHLYFGVV